MTWVPEYVEEWLKIPIEERPDDFFVSSYFKEKKGVPERVRLAALRVLADPSRANPNRYDGTASHSDATSALREIGTVHQVKNELELCDRCKGRGYRTEDELTDYHKREYRTNYLTCQECSGGGIIEVVTETLTTRRRRTTPDHIREELLKNIKNGTS